MENYNLIQPHGGYRKLDSFKDAQLLVSFYKNYSPVLLKIATLSSEIKRSGTASTTKLTVLKRWFNNRRRICGFAAAIANVCGTAPGRKTREEKALFQEASRLFQPVLIFARKLKIDRKKANRLYDNLRDFQNKSKGHGWNRVRVIGNMDLFRIELALEIILHYPEESAVAYKLAAKFCERYNPKYGNALTKESLNAIGVIAWFMREMENVEREEKAAAKGLLKNN
jgi:hypothetical protein